MMELILFFVILAAAVGVGFALASSNLQADLAEEQRRRATEEAKRVERVHKAVIPFREQDDKDRLLAARYDQRSGEWKRRP